MNNITIDYHIPKVGGIFTQVTAEFNRGSLIGLSRCLKANMNDAGVMIEYEYSKDNMITKLNFTDHTIKSYAIRKLTPKECFRLMGVRDNVIDTMQSSNAQAAYRLPDWKGKGKPEDMAISASQQYKQAGNSIVVDVLENIFENLFYPSKDNIIREEDGITYKVQDNGQISFF